MNARIESITFGDFSRKVTLNENVLKEFEKSCYTDENIIINYILSIDKNFRKYGIHVNEKFFIWFM